MTAIVETRALTKRYGRRTALADCTLTVPAGRVVGLVGPNGAGKSTLLQLTCGLLTPTSGTVEVFGRPPAADAAQLGRVGFVAQDTPTYAALTIDDHLRLGAKLNPRWDAALADRRIRQLGLDPTQRAGRLSGGQRAQLALTLAVAKRPELLLLDEPVAALDPLARRAFLQSLMEFVAESESQATVVLSSHLVSDLERVCDHLIVLAGSRIQADGEIDDLLATHFRLTTARRDADTLPAGMRVVHAEHTERQSTFVVRADAAVHDPSWVMEPLGLEDLVLAHLEATADPRPALEAQR
ncbi:ABC transporter ATP-binding protein [Kitasatospora sp. NPDC059673]|uniref:ABC transporter ATP-binding protein n=1 Tax=Kitasatospora sp. NPDC059673 TaxID=3346901 RepID=UPI0036ADDDD8